MKAGTSHRRGFVWIATLALATIFAAIAVLSYNSPGNRAKRHFWDALTSGRPVEGLAGDAKRMGTERSVAALADLLEHQPSAAAEDYAKLYARIPKVIQRAFPAPVSALEVLKRDLQLLGELGEDAKPAVPAMIRLYQHSNPKLAPLRLEVLVAWRKIGPAAGDAIPALLPGLDPTNSLSPHEVASTLLKIDPSGGGIDLAWRALWLQPGYPPLASNVCSWCLESLQPVRTSSYSRRAGPWLAFQVLGMLRSESRRSIPMIRPYLEDENGVLRGLSATSLGMIGLAAADTLPALRLRCQDDWLVVRQAATNAILAIETRLSPQP